MPCGVRCDPVELADPCIPARRVDTRSVKDCCIIDTCDSSDLIRLQCGYQQSSSYRHKKNACKTYSSPALSPVGLPGFSITHSSPELRQRLQGGSSAPTQRIFIFRQ